MTESHRPRHSLDDDYNDGYENGYENGYDEAFTFDEPAGDRRPQAEEPKGLPLRGLAMILLAVAIILIGWGGYSLMSGDDDSGSDSTTAQEAGTPGNSPAPGTADQSTAAAPQDPNANQEGQTQPAPQDQAGNAGAQGGVDKKNAYITVLNNSRVQGLAGDVAGKLGRDQWQKTGVGNLPDQSGTFPTSVVLYPRGDAQAKANAEAVARDLGLKAEERTPEVDQAIAGARMLEGPPPAGVIVVTTNDMPR